MIDLKSTLVFVSVIFIVLLFVVLCFYWFSLIRGE